MRRMMMLAGALLLAGCGGSDDDHHASGPPPVVPLKTGEYRPPSDGVALGGTIQFDTDGAKNINLLAGVGTPNFGIVFDNDRQRYIVGDNAASASFGAADLVEETSGDDAHVFFATRHDNVLDYLTIYKNPSDSKIAKYGAIGAWENDYVLPTVIPVTRKRTDWFGYGSPTLESDVPKNGNGYYDIQGRGTIVGVSNVSAVKLAVSTLSVNFSTGTISGSLIIDNSGDNVGPGTSPGGSFNDPQLGPTDPFNPPDIFGRTKFRLVGTIRGNVGTGTVTGPNGANGHFNLAFLGPNVQNVTLVASAQNNATAFTSAALGVGVFNPGS